MIDKRINNNLKKDTLNVAIKMLAAIEKNLKMEGHK
jgi:hypothetical protein